MMMARMMMTMLDLSSPPQPRPSSISPPLLCWTAQGWQPAHSGGDDDDDDDDGDGGNDDEDDDHDDDDDDDDDDDEKDDEETSMIVGAEQMLRLGEGGATRFWSSKALQNYMYRVAEY